MFLTASSKIVPLRLATEGATHPGVPARATRVADSALSPVASSPAESTDLATEIARRLEQDVDYQILRKTFALDAERRNQARAGVVTRDSRLASSRTLAADTTASSQHAVVRSTQAVRLQASWTQAIEMRLELSASGADAGVTQSTASTGSRRQTLEFSLGEPAPVQVGDPLVLDLGGRGVMTTGIPSGVLFDLDGDGQTERMSTVTGESWFLALDWNANGRIDDGHELFGDQNGAAHGFAELARHDGNADGVIDAGDAVFANLRLVQLGEGGAQVSQSLSEANVTRIELGYQNVRKALDLYDQVAQSGRFTRADGTQGEAADVLLGYRDLG